VAVFIVHNDNTKNFEALSKYGVVRSITTKAIFPDNANIRIGEFISRIHKFIRKYDPRKDYLVMAGHPVYIAMIAAYLAARGHKEIRVLQYDRDEKTYYPLILPITIRKETKYEVSRQNT